MGRKFKETAFFSLLFFMVISCVTINIYFPAAAVEKAADEIVEEVWGEEGAESEKKQEGNKPQSFLNRWTRFASIEIGIKEAYAQEADINVTTPSIRALKGSIQKRAAFIKPYLDRGSVGITNEGLLIVRSTEGLRLKEKAGLKRLIDAENKDREALYLEIARANNFSPDKVPDIKRIFAGSWIKKAKKGWQVQGADGKWSRKD